MARIRLLLAESSRPALRIARLKPVCKGTVMDDCI
jgi:hypothetical protein